MSASRVVPLALFVVYLLGLLIWLANQSDFDLPRMQMKMAVLTQGVGLFLAAAGGLGLLLAAAAGEPPARTAAYVLPTLAGGLLIGPSWGVAVGLGIAAAALAIGPWFRRGGRHGSAPDEPVL